MSTSQMAQAYYLYHLVLGKTSNFVKIAIFSCKMVLILLGFLYEQSNHPQKIAMNSCTANFLRTELSGGRLNQGLCI